MKDAPSDIPTAPLHPDLGPRKLTMYSFYKFPFVASSWAQWTKGAGRRTEEERKEVGQGICPLDSPYGAILGWLGTLTG